MYILLDKDEGSGELSSIERIREIPEYSGTNEFSCNFPEQIVKKKTTKWKINRHNGIKG